MQISNNNIPQGYEQKRTKNKNQTKKYYTYVSMCSVLVPNAVTQVGWSCVSLVRDAVVDRSMAALRYYQI